TAVFLSPSCNPVIVDDMHTKRLGNSDLELTPIGVGAWAMGGGGWAFAWGPQDDDESIEAIHTALDRGVNWIENREIAKSLKADSIRRECEASLRRLKVDTIDLYQIHWPEPDEDIEEG